MTLSGNPGHKSELKNELQNLREQMMRLVDVTLNGWFELKAGSAYYRLACLVIFLLLAGFVVSLTLYPLREWRNHLQQFFIYLFNSTNKSIKANSFFDLIRLGARAYLNPYVCWYAPAFFVPIFIAYQAASFYLADIFNLDRVSIARKFIRQVALTGGRNVIHITEGDIAAEDQYSPIAKIGGPGKVIVNLDSVALFEKADGRPNIIGPTEKERKGKATLDGFERFRQAFDLRDQYIDLRDDDGKKSAVKSRSLDGIPVTATDVRFMFSVYRGTQKPTPEIPYPYKKEAIEQQVYKSTSKVTPHLTDPSQLDFVFENSILSLVRRELSGFMSQNKLTEYLASISEREVKKAEDQEKMVAEAARVVLEPFESVEDPKPDKRLTPTFIPRHKITDLFSQFAEKFTDDARARGVELHWIGVGTWNVPVELVPEKHLEAWKMSQENTVLDQEMNKA